MSVPQFIRLITKAGAVALILIGLVALVTPLTPGSWLAPIGLGILIGKKRMSEILTRVGLKYSGGIK